MTVAIPLWAIIAAMGVVIVWLAFWVDGLRTEVAFLKRRMRFRIFDLMAEPGKAAEFAKRWEHEDGCREVGNAWCPPKAPPPPPPRKDDDGWRRTWKSSTTESAEKPKKRSKVPPRPIPRPAAKKEGRA